MLRAALRMLPIPRGGHGAGRAARRNHSRPYHASTTRNSLAVAVAVKPIPAADDDRQRHFSEQTFADAPISNASKSGIKHQYLSDVQAATLESGLAGKDLLVQAKTGTGKTMAFLLPTVERLAKRQELPRKGQISALILSPTRELAMQIEEEAKTLLAHHQFRVQHAVGGTNVNSEMNRFQTERCDIVVATPGRLLAHLENAKFQARFANLKSLILDEADTLLDQGFLNDLEKIFAKLPSKSEVPRQAMLFSATMNTEVKQVVNKALNPNYEFITTLTAEEVNTHEHVQQSVFTVDISKSLPATFAVLREDFEAHGNASKVMVFFPTARSTAVAAEVFRNIKGLPPVFEIHSRKSQPARSKASEEFKNAKSAILFSSDVAARGMDFPGVTLVIQTGMPSSAEQYIHRLGRTARAGASGRGVLILAPFEKFFLQQPKITALPISAHRSINDLPTEEIDTALDIVGQTTKEQAYRAWLGYYATSAKKMNLTLTQLVEIANTYAVEILRYKGGQPPPVLAKTVGLMGLKGVPGLNIQKF